MKLIDILLITLTCLLLVSCGLVTSALNSAGIPVGSDATEAAIAVDKAIVSWVDKALWGLIGIVTSESTRATTKIVKKRRAKALEKKVGD